MDNFPKFEDIEIKHAIHVQQHTVLFLHISHVVIQDHVILLCNSTTDVIGSLHRVHW